MNIYKIIQKKIVFDCSPTGENHNSFLKDKRGKSNTNTTANKLSIPLKQEKESINNHRIHNISKKVLNLQIYSTPLRVG